MLTFLLKELKAFAKDAQTHELEEMLNKMPVSFRSLIFVKGCDLLIQNLKKTRSYTEEYYESLHDNLIKTSQVVKNIQKVNDSFEVEDTNVDTLSLQGLPKGS